MSKQCTCPIRPNMTYRELLDEVLPFEGPTRNCCRHLGYLCPDLVQELERARKEFDQGKWYRKQRAQKLRERGISEEEIQQELERPTRKRRKKEKKFIKRATVDLGSF